MIERTNKQDLYMVVDPGYADKFNKLFHDKGLRADETFLARTSIKAGDIFYISFVRHNRDPQLEFCSPYDGTAPAEFFNMSLKPF